MVFVVAVAFVGLARRLADVHWAIGIGCGLLYGAGPAMLTRLGVGHLGQASAMALLPWILPILLDPVSDLRRTTMAGIGVGLCGYFGWWLTLPVLAVGLVRPWNGWRSLAAIFAFVSGNLWWIISSWASLRAGAQWTTSESFVTRAAGANGLLRLVVGYGFWQEPNQIGSRHVAVLGVAVALIALAVVGHAEGKSQFRCPMLAVGLIGLAVSLASTIPGIRAIYSWATGWSALAGLREGQRLLPLFLLWVVISAGHGAQRIADASQRPARSLLSIGALLTASSFVLVGSSWFGLGGRLEVRKLPAGWAEVLRLSDQSGAVLALPWTQYYDVPLAGGARAHHPVPFAVDGDVIYSHQLGLEADESEGVDERESAAARLVLKLRDREDVAVELAGLGVRFVVADRRAEPTLAQSLTKYPGLRTRFADSDVVIAELIHWRSVPRLSRTTVPATVAFGATMLAFAALGTRGLVRRKSMTSFPGP